MQMVKRLLFIALLTVVSTQLLAQKHRKVKIKTAYGKMVFLLSDETPLHRDNFIKLAKEHFYDGLLFHRVIKDFMIQGGDPHSKDAKPGALLGQGGVGYTIPAEFKKDLFHQKGALAMAREGDRVNPKRASSGCQFYIVEGKTYTDEELDRISKQTGRHFTDEQRKVYKTVGGTPFLDGQYTVFGTLVKGADVLDQIATLKADAQDRPVTDVPMKVRLVHKFLFF